MSWILLEQSHLPAALYFFRPCRTRELNPLLIPANELAGYWLSSLRDIPLPYGRGSEIGRHGSGKIELNIFVQ